MEYDYNKIANNINKLKEQGVPEERIRSVLSNAGINVQDINKAYAKQYTPASEEGGVLQSIVQGLVQGLAKLPTQVAATGYGLGQAYKGATKALLGMDTSKETQNILNLENEGSGLDFGYLGKNVKPLGGGYSVFDKDESGKALKSAVGSGLEGASYLIGGGQLKAGLTGAKALGNLALQGAKTSAISGSLYGAGESMQNDESIVDTLLNTVKGGVIGGVTGGILSPAFSVAGKGVSSALSNVKEKGIKQGVVDSIGNVIDNILPTKTTSITQDVIDNNLSTDFKKGMKSYDSLLQESQKTIKPLQGASSDIQDAYMKEISSIDNPFTEIIEGGEKKLSLMPALEKVTTDIKSLAEKGTTIAKEYKGTSIAPEVVDEINNLAAQKMSSGVVGKTKEFQNALKKEINNFYLNDNLSLDELLNIKRNIDISNILESSTEASAQKEARAVIKEALSNKIHEKLPEIANLDSQISQKMKFMSLFANDKSIFKGGTSTLQDIGGIAASILAAPQGIIVSYTLRNAAQKILSKIAPGVSEFISSTTKAKPEINNLIQKLTSNGVDENLASQFLRENSQYGKPTINTTKQVIEQLQNFTEQGIKNTEEQAVKKLTEAKSLIKIIKGLGTDIETIKEVVNEAGKDITDTQAKALAAMNKHNTSKSISSYLELLNSLPQKAIINTMISDSNN